MEIDTVYILLMHYFIHHNLIENTLVFGLQKLGVDID